MLEDTLEELTRQLIEERFKGSDIDKKYVITKEELYSFCIKLIKVIMEVYNE